MNDMLRTQVDAIVSNAVPNRHTFFQLNFFVLGKEPTHQAKMKKCVDELKARKTQVESAKMEIDDLADRNELLALDLAGTSFSSDQEKEVKSRMVGRRIQQNERAIASLRETIASVEEEMLFFAEAFARLSEIEPFRQWDDVNVQAEYWNARLTEEVNHRLIMQMPVDFETVRTVLSLPAEAPVKKKVAALIHKNIDKVMALKESTSPVA